MLSYLLLALIQDFKKMLLYTARGDVGRETRLVGKPTDLAELVWVTCHDTTKK